MEQIIFIYLQLKLLRFSRPGGKLYTTKALEKEGQIADFFFVLEVLTTQSICCIFYTVYIFQDHFGARDQDDAIDFWTFH